MQLSAWEKESFFAPQDIIIIGSGLVGLWSAWELKNNRPGSKITILERGFIPAGASTRNAGFACFGSPTELLNDKVALGEDAMWKIVEMRYRGIEKTRKIFGESLIDFEYCGGYEVYSAGKFDNVFNDEVEWLNKGLKQITGTQDCFKLSNKKLAAFGFRGFDAMIENKLEGYLHSGKLLQSLLQKVQALGVQVFTNAEVTGWSKVNGKIVINCKGDWNFTAERLLVCANAFTSALCKGVNVVPARGQVILTNPIDGLKMKGTFHFEQGYYYFRDLGGRVLLGGARNKAFEAERTTAPETSAEVQSELERFLSDHLLPGEDFRIEQRWSGIMGFTEDKQPILEKVDESTYVAVSCNGMGVALAPVIAEKVCEMMG